ncbi:hypothetical protein [Chryseobacterium sp.]|uniref:hypothetical protein n=1 Tax=Chryseobacterium sp. TaxID=1871047 RepID=UPI0026332E68|nr:hypothetical protein [Chryseobacterium sp.]
MSKRMRVFAGPNGSGKSSIIKKILTTEVKKGVTLDFGSYINADDIAQDLLKKGHDFSNLKITWDQNEFYEIVVASGLINNEFTFDNLKESISVDVNKFILDNKFIKDKKDKVHERAAQIIADYFRKKLLTEDKKFSFETVFSHPGKVDIIKQAAAKGYKVYLYFVSTEHPDINIYRIKKVRVKQKGHDVPEEKIVSRYYRSMDLLYEAAQNVYQAYFFDNSKEGGDHTMFAHFKLSPDGEKMWDESDPKIFPDWFKIYYSGKIKK